MSADNSSSRPPPTGTNSPEISGDSSPPPPIPDHQLLKRIGRGSYGEVWLARNMMEEYRSVKIIFRKSFRDDRPFERELSGIRKFEPVSRSHEGFIDILHVGINEKAGYFYYVMEAGDDLAFGPDIRPETYSPKTLGRAVSLQGPLTLHECVKLALALSLALSELHKRGLVHRDIKPSNIIFVNGIPKLADIGLVAEIDEAHSYVGTEGFIAPEGPGSPQGDIYSLGKTLYEVSTGKDRHDFPEFPTLLADLPDLDGFLELNEVILNACKNDLKSRYQAAWDMHTDLLLVAGGKSVKRLKVLERRLANLKRVAVILMLGSLVMAAVLYQIYRDWKGAVESRQRQVGANIAYGNQALDSGDLLGSLPYFANALELDSDNRNAIATDRLRIGSVLGQCPKLTHLWSEGVRVNNAEFSPDGSRVLVAEEHGPLKVYDLKTGRVCSRSFGNSNLLWTAVFSPDGQFIATANRNASGYLLAASDLAEISCFPHRDWIDSVRFSPDGRQIVTACRDGIARVWNVQNQKVVLSLTNSHKIRCADFSPDGHLLATASEDQTACIWDREKGTRRVLPHPDWVNYVAFSPDSKKIVTACADHRARVWDTSSGQQILPDLVHGDGVTSAEFSPDGRLVLTASLDGDVRLWLADSLQPLMPIPIIRHGERLLQAHFSRDGRQIITSGVDGTVRVWDLAGVSVPPRPMPYITSENGYRFSKLTKDNIETRDVESQELVGPPIRAPSQPQRIIISPNGRFMAAVTRCENRQEKRLQVWDAGVGTAIGPEILLSNMPPEIALSDDGGHLVSFEGKSARLWDVQKGTCVSISPSNSESYDMAIFNSSVTQFAIISGSKMEIRDARTGDLCFSPLLFSQLIHSAEFSWDGFRIVGCCWDPYYTKCYAQVWSTVDGKSVGPRLMQGDGVLSASFSPDGAHVVTAGEDFTAIVWDAVTGLQLIPPVLHGEKVRSASFSPDGKWFVTASFDKSARVWNTETGDPLTPPLRHLSELTNAVFLADGRSLVTYDGTGEYRVWPLPVDNRPIEDLVLLSRLLSGYTETRFGKLTSQTSESLETTWKQLRSRYPSSFDVSTEEIEKWHEFQAEVSDDQKQWLAEAFHLKRLLALRPNDEAIFEKLATVNKLLKEGN